MNTAATLVLLGTVTITAGATATHYLNGDDGTVTANVATALGAPRDAEPARPGDQLAAAAMAAGGKVVLLPCPSDGDGAEAPADGQLCAYLDTSPEAIAAGVVPGGPPPGPTIGQELAGVVQSYAVSELSGNAAAVVANQIGGPLGNVLGAGVAEAIGVLGAGGGFGDLFGKLAFRMAETYALGELDKSPFGRQVAFAYRAYGTVRGLIGFVDTCSHSIVRCVAGAPVQVAAVSDLVRSIPYAFPAPEPEETWTFAGEALPEYTLANLDPATAELLGIELPSDVSVLDDPWLIAGGASDTDYLAGIPSPDNPLSYYGPDLVQMRAYENMPRQRAQGGARILIKGTETTLGVENTREAGVAIGLWLVGTGRADVIEALDFANSNVSADFVRGLQQAHEMMAAAETMNNVQQVMNILGALTPLAQAARARLGGRAVRAASPGEIRLARARLGVGITKTACFVAGTLIATPGGPVPIETLRVGDLVLARDPGTGEVAARPVDAVFVRPGMPVFEVDLARAGRTDTVVVTAGHPFFVRGRGWVDSERLAAGDPVVTADGEVATVAALRDRGQIATVHNLEVREFHTYFVGTLGAWVHNETRCQLVARFRDRYVMGGRVDQAAIDAFKKVNPGNHITVNQQLRGGKTVHEFQENSRFDNGPGRTDPKGLPRDVDSLPKGTRILMRDGWIGGDASKYTLARSLGHTEFSTIREIWERYQVSKLYPDLKLVQPGDVFKITSTNRDSKLVLPPCRSCQQAMRDAAQLMPDIKIEYRWTDTAGKVHVWTPANRTLNYEATVQNGKAPIYDGDSPRI